MRHSAALVILLLLLVVGAPAADTTGEKPDTEVKKTEDLLQTKLIRLRYASAGDVARMFGAKGSAIKGGDPTVGRRSFLERALRDATGPVSPLPEMTAPGLYPFKERNYAEVRVAQVGFQTGGAGQGGGTLGGVPGGLRGGGGGTQSGAASGLLPEGMEPPIAFLDDNALVVRGTAAAIDEFQEILKMLDVKPKQVNIEVKLVNTVTRLQKDWGVDTSLRNRDMRIDVMGPAPGGSTVRWGDGNINQLLGAYRSESFSNNTAGANITTRNNSPCVIRASTLIPFVAATVSYNQFGQRTVDYTVDAVATGVELFCVPRINGDESITMYLRPSFIEPTGTVVGPDGTSIPITEEVMLDTQVTVMDGQTLVIGGMPRSTETLETVGMPINFKRSSLVEDSESILFVTPRIVRELPQR